MLSREKKNGKFVGSYERYGDSVDGSRGKLTYAVDDAILPSHRLCQSNMRDGDVVCGDVGYSQTLNVLVIRSV